MNPKIVTWLLALSIILNVCLILLFLNRNSNNFTSTGENQKEDVISIEASKSGSGRITKDTSDLLRSNYRKDRKHLKTIDSMADANKAVALEGFVFDAEQIREIVDYNKSGQKPDQLAIYFGLISNGGVIGIGKHRNWHLIALGRYKGKPLDYNKDDPASGVSAVTALKDASIFDKADPCPPCKTP